MNTKLSKEKITFVEEMAGTLERAAGLPRMGGRIWAVLLISEEEYLSAEQLMEQVQASRGSVSTMVRTLERIGMVQRVTRRGDRKHYYKAAGADALMHAELASIALFIQLMETGQRALTREDHRAAARLGEIHDLMKFFKREYAALLERWHKTKAGS
ncbi:MAG: MarR family transcriptional regulator [Bacteroidetes bacterium]|nr:MarR family transcriptional regulator [Bacteroidota bacterium]